jgi:hypothetical protein
MSNKQSVNKQSGRLDTGGRRAPSPDPVHMTTTEKDMDAGGDINGGAGHCSGTDRPVWLAYSKRTLSKSRLPHRRNRNGRAA